MAVGDGRAEEIIAGRVLKPAVNSRRAIERRKVFFLYRFRVFSRRFKTAQDIAAARVLVVMIGKFSVAVYVDADKRILTIELFDDDVVFRRHVFHVPAYRF